MRVCFAVRMNASTKIMSGVSTNCMLALVTVISGFRACFARF